MNIDKSDQKQFSSSGPAEADIKKTNPAISIGTVGTPHPGKTFLIQPDGNKKTEKSESAKPSPFSDL